MPEEFVSSLPLSELRTSNSLLNNGKPGISLARLPGLQSAGKADAWADRIERPGGIVSDQPIYRAFVMRKDGGIEQGQVLHCASDEEAVELARQLVDGHDVEVWERARKVTTLQHTGPSSTSQ